jgi:hypothetical protein
MNMNNDKLNRLKSLVSGGEVKNHYYSGTLDKRIVKKGSIRLMDRFNHGRLNNSSFKAGESFQFEQSTGGGNAGSINSELPLANMKEGSKFTWEHGKKELSSGSYTLKSYVPRNGELHVVVKKNWSEPYKHIDGCFDREVKTEREYNSTRFGEKGQLIEETITIDGCERKHTKYRANGDLNTIIDYDVKGVMTKKVHFLEHCIRIRIYKKGVMSKAYSENFEVRGMCSNFSRRSGMTFKHFYEVMDRKVLNNIISLYKKGEPHFHLFK